MRFNDYHKQICAALELDETACRRERSACIRLYSRSVTVGAAIEIMRVRLAPPVDTRAVTPSEPPR